MLNMPSSVYFPEEAEEDRRVSTVRPYCLHRWFVERPQGRYTTSKGKDGKYFLRPAEAFVLPGGKSELSTEKPRRRPVFATELVPGTPADRMAAFIKLAPNNVFVIYDKARDKKRGDIVQLLTLVVGELFQAGELDKPTVKYIRKTFGARAKEDPIAKQIVVAISAS